MKAGLHLLSSAATGGVLPLLSFPFCPTPRWRRLAAIYSTQPSDSLPTRPVIDPHGRTLIPSPTPAAHSPAISSSPSPPTDNGTNIILLQTNLFLWQKIKEGGEGLVGVGRYLAWGTQCYIQNRNKLRVRYFYLRRSRRS